MDTAELLKQAWTAVDESGVPPELYETAFTLAISHLSGAAGTPTMAPPTPVTAIGAGPAAGVQESPADSDGIYARLSTESGVSESDIREVILIEPDGTIAVLAPGRQLGNSNAARARTVASLLAGVYFGGLNKRSIPLEVLREACDDRGCYDQTNFKSKHIGTHDALSVRQNDVHINQSKWVVAFESAVSQARGAA